MGAVKSTPYLLLGEVSTLTLSFITLLRSAILYAGDHLANVLMLLNSWLPGGWASCLLAMEPAAWCGTRGLLGAQCLMNGVSPCAAGEGLCSWHFAFN